MRGISCEPDRRLHVPWVIGNTGIYDEEVRSAFSAISSEAISGHFSSHLLKGIFAGWLIALMIWLLPMAESARIWVIIILTWLIGIGGLPHIVAGSLEAFYSAATGGSGWRECLLFMIPTLIGNIIGGILLVSAINHSQAVADTAAKD